MARLRTLVVLEAVLSIFAIRFAIQRYPSYVARTQLQEIFLLRLLLRWR